MVYQNKLVDSCYLVTDVCDIEISMLHFLLFCIMGCLTVLSSSDQ